MNVEHGAGNRGEWPVDVGGRRRRAQTRLGPALGRGTLAAVLAVGALAPGCGGDDGGEDPGTTEPGSEQVDGAAISLTELLDREAGGSPGDNVLVVAVLFDDGSGLRLCDALAESFPPQCVGRSIDVRNPDAVDVELTEEQGVRWTDQAVQLLGWVEDGEFVVT